MPDSNTPAPVVSPVVSETAPTTPEAPKPERQSKQWAAQLSASAKLRAQQESFKAERAKLDSDLKVVNEYKEAQALIKTKPLDALKKMGLSYNDILQAGLSPDGEITPDTKIKQLGEEFSSYKAQQAEAAKQAQLEQKAALEAAAQTTRKGWFDHVTKTISDTQENYPHIAMVEQFNLVAEEIEAHLEKTGKTGNPVILEPEEAAKIVDERIATQTRADLKRMLGKPHLMKLFAEVQAETSKSETTKVIPPKVPQMKPQTTLSNKMAPTTAAVATDKGKTPDQIFRELLERRRNAAANKVG